MGNLPVGRVIAPERAFTIAGLDYAGPIKLRASKGRGRTTLKGYIALFICFSFKAVHLEAVSDLSTAGFSAVYRRFVGRRGVCRTIYSDRGKNFQGAAKELARMFNVTRQRWNDLVVYPSPHPTLWWTMGGRGEVC